MAGNDRVRKISLDQSSNATPNHQEHSAERPKPSEKDEMTICASGIPECTLISLFGREMQ